MQENIFGFGRVESPLRTLSNAHVSTRIDTFRPVIPHIYCGAYNFKFRILGTASNLHFIKDLLAVQRCIRMAPSYRRTTFNRTPARENGRERLSRLYTEVIKSSSNNENVILKWIRHRYAYDKRIIRNGELGYASAVRI